MSVLFGYSPNGNPSTADFTAVATKFGRKVDLQMTYQAWSEPMLYSSQLASATALGAEPSVTWEPQVTLGSVVNGSQDAVINAAIGVAKSYGKPILCRPAHEMNGNWMSYGQGREEPEAFVAGWTYLVDQFRTAGAGNVEFCWCPNVWGLQGSPCVDPTPFFPGDEWVDYVGLDGYCTSGAPNLSFPTLFLASYATVTNLSARPFLVGETGVQAGAASSRAAWFAGMFLTVATQMPRCMAVQYWGRSSGGAGDCSPDASGADPNAGAVFSTGWATPYFEVSS